MKKYNLLLLIIPFLITSCAEQPADKQSHQESHSLEDVELVAEYDTVKVATLYMKVVGKENMIQANYSEGMSNEDIAANALYDNLVYVEVAGSLYADNSEEGYVADESGTVKSKMTVYDMLHMDMEDVHQPFRVSVITNITNFDSWKKAFDEEELNRQNAGMRSLQIGVNPKDPQEVFMLIAIEDIAKARQMMEHDGLRKKMKDAGVVGDPKVKFWRPAGPQTEEL